MREPKKTNISIPPPHLIHFPEPPPPPPHRSPNINQTLTREAQEAFHALHADDVLVGSERELEAADGDNNVREAGNGAAIERVLVRVDEGCCPEHLGDGGDFCGGSRQERCARIEDGLLYGGNVLPADADPAENNLPVRGARDRDVLEGGLWQKQKKKKGREGKGASGATSE